MVKKDSCTVIKFGGNAFGEGDKAIFADIERLRAEGNKVILVHGGGPEITKELEKMGIKSEFRGGLRVTADQVTAKAISDILTNIGKRIAGAITGAVAMGGGSKILTARKKNITDVDLGYVGDVASVDVDKIAAVCQSGIAVVSPAAQDKYGNYYNINADDVALAVAKAVKADKLIFLTNVDGVMKDVKDAASLLTDLKASEAADLIRDGVIAGGMIPKIRSCIKGAENGVKEVFIANGSHKESPLYALVSGDRSVRATRITQ